MPRPSNYTMFKQRLEEIQAAFIRDLPAMNNNALINAFRNKYVEFTRFEDELLKDINTTNAEDLAMFIMIQRITLDLPSIHNIIALTFLNGNNHLFLDDLFTPEQNIVIKSLEKEIEEILNNFSLDAIEIEIDNQISSIKENIMDKFVSQAFSTADLLTEFRNLLRTISV